MQLHILSMGCVYDGWRAGGEGDVRGVRVGGEGRRANVSTAKKSFKTEDPKNKTKQTEGPIKRFQRRNTSLSIFLLCNLGQIS